jgi:hypothetical protein
MVATVTVNNVLDGHVALDIECLDRIYIKGYVPSLQTGGAVVSFLTVHLDPGFAQDQMARALPMISDRLMVVLEQCAREGGLNATASARDRAGAIGAPADPRRDRPARQPIQLAGRRLGKAPA